MDRRLDSLSDRFKPLAILLLARLVEAQIPVIIVNTRRTLVEQQAAVASGHSWVSHSLHQDGDAIDICPYQQYIEHGVSKLQWDGGDPVWQRIGQLGEGLGLRWGGRWHPPDLGHFEYHVAGVAPRSSGVA